MVPHPNVVLFDVRVGYSKAAHPCTWFGQQGRVDKEGSYETNIVRIFTTRLERS